MLRSAEKLSLEADLWRLGVLRTGSEEWSWNPKRVLMALAVSDMNGISGRIEVSGSGQRVGDEQMGEVDLNLGGLVRVEVNLNLGEAMGRGREICDRTVITGFDERSG